MAKGAEALVPAILGGVKKQVQTQAGSPGGLGGLLTQLGGGLLENVLSPQPTDVGLGNNVLGQIFGSKDVSRAVAANAAAQSGLDPALLKKMLPHVGHAGHRVHGQAKWRILRQRLKRRWVGWCADRCAGRPVWQRRIWRGGARRITRRSGWIRWIDVHAGPERRRQPTGRYFELGWQGSALRQQCLA